MTLDDILPHAHFSERHARRISAPPVVVWRALHDVRLTDSPLASLLMGIRTLPALVAGAAPRAMVSGPFLEHAPIPVLARDPDRRIVAGGVLQPWKLQGGARPPLLDAVSLRTFDEPGWVKCGMDFVLEQDRNDTVLRTETRVLATDATTRTRFAL